MQDIQQLSAMEVKALNHVLQMVRDILDQEKQTAEMQLQLNKICELEDAFVKNFDKAKWEEYFDLDLEKGKFTDLELDHSIELTIKICKELFR